MRPVWLIAGPTASGKSDCGLQVAKALGKRQETGVIINADSMQVYADIPVLSAAPTKIEMKHCEHRLYGAWDGAEACSAAQWAARAKAEIEALHEEGKTPILVGGTGMYLKVLLEGIAPIPKIDPLVREQVRMMETADAYTALQLEDPLRADVLEPGDSQRIARALEVKRSTGVALADWQQAKSGGIAEDITLNPIMLMPERQWVYDRCDTRFAQMLENGAIEEVEALLARDLSPDLPVMRAIGVPEIAQLVRGEITREEAIEAGGQSTRQYAKRQFTWLRNQCPPEWPRVPADDVSSLLP